MSVTPDAADRRAAIRKLESVLAQLRHAYENIHNERVSRRGQKDFADGLLAPQIRKLEQLHRDWSQQADADAATIAQLRAALTDLRDYFAYGQHARTGMSAGATPRCAPSVWKEIKRRVEAALGTVPHA